MKICLLWILLLSYLYCQRVLFVIFNSSLPRFKMIGMFQIRHSLYNDLTQSQFSSSNYHKVDLLLHFWGVLIEKFVECRQNWLELEDDKKKSDVLSRLLLIQRLEHKENNIALFLKIRKDSIFTAKLEDIISNSFFEKSRKFISS